MDASAKSATPLQEIVIQGITESGRAFRPSDWSERLCGMMSVFSEDRHLSYSPYLKPVVSAGLSCVVVDRKLETLDPAAFQFLMDFARDNELRTRPGRNPVAIGSVPEAPERRIAEAQQGAAS
jgi:Protein of unknown function (DUF3579)